LPLYDVELFHPIGRSSISKVTGRFRALEKRYTLLEFSLQRNGVKMGIQNAYDEWSETYDTDENLTRDLDQRVTLELFSNLQFDSILEIGCGTGKNTVFLAKIGSVVYAVDF
jgi:SAM-dependent methyltransferase